ncbi:MAG: hypothetical protein J6J57_00195 [Alistipes sp.]|nr:hypothetical protein [Alistipes sp.]
MKKLIFSMLIVAVAASVSCSSSKKVAQAPVPGGMVEDVVPLSGPQYRGDANYYRAVQNGLSAERSMAQKIAMQNCRQELAASIQADVQTVIESYAKSQSTGMSSEVKNQYQELAYTVVNQRMTDVQVVDEKIYREASGEYRYYVCLQMPKKAIAEAVEEKLVNDAKLNLEFDREQFKKIFQEHMAAFSRQ